MNRRITLPAMAVILFSLTLVMVGLSSQKGKEVQFGGTYANLKPAQRNLVDEWIRQYNTISKGNLKSAETYDDLSLSVRTTFEAVTHALMTSKLTSESGTSLGTALDVVAYLETVHGMIPESSGDLQFRIYVALKPTALQTLEESREFKRTGDNTVYHKGYPINYRQQGGTPSIQISCSPDGKRADIDVDYRSSKFPKAVVNGHLSSANSDVRAGNNYDRHVQRWSGFGDWWKSIFGVPLKESDLKEEQTTAKRGEIPKVPRAGKGKLEDAVYDFLNSWLVEQQPIQAVAYISRQAYACINQVESDEEPKINPGMAPFLIVNGMKKANRTMGKPSSLAEIAFAVQPKDPALKLIKQPHSALFELFETPDEMAFNFECANRSQAQPAATAGKPGGKYGKFFGASLRLKTSNAKSATLLTLWSKESGYWKILSWKVESDQFQPKQVPNAAAAILETKIERTTGDPSVITATLNFFQDWFVKQKYQQAAAYLSPKCLPCVNLHTDEQKQKAQKKDPAASWPEGQRRILNGMKNASDTIGKKSELSEAIRSLSPSNPIIKLVSHPQEQAYALVSVPDEVARNFECSSQAEGVKVAQKPNSPPVYGNFYGTVCELKVKGSPAALRILWGKEAGQWKIIAYSVEVP
ncbi:MAG: hypothetical protein U0V70_03560 [Terriglobia bacterium]